MTLRYLLTAAALALASLTLAADPIKVTDDGPKVAPPPPPVIQLPPEPVVNVAAFDALKVKETPWDLALVKVPEAHAKNPAARGKGLKVVVHDTGCQVDHPGLHGCVKGGYNAITRKAGLDQVADGNGHGTWCVGAVHAVVPDAEIYVVKCLSDTGSGSVADIAAGIDYATTAFGVDVHSLSLGGSSPDDYLPPAVERATAAGGVVVCAAGNDGGGAGRDTEGYPARYKQSISVAACDKDRNLAAFSSWGPNVFTTDPGVRVTGLLPGSREGEMSGTSMACPKQAGKCASWIASNAVPKDKDRAAKFRAAVQAASPFQERNNARGFGLYTLDKITGLASVLPPPAPGPVPLVVTQDDLIPEKRALLNGATFRLEIAVPGGGLAVGSPQPQPAAPVPTWTGFSPAPVWAPPPVVYQPMPAPPLRFGVQGPFGGGVVFTRPCVGGACPPPVRR